MIQLNRLKLNYRHTEEELLEAVSKKLQIMQKDLLSYTIVKKSVDARNKPDILYEYTLNINLKNENKILKRHKNVKKIEDNPYIFSISGEKKLNKPPVIIGSGPAGLFCALMLARHGYRPIILERGEDVDARTRSVHKFWETGILKTDSNVQFGEGGAGTFSDGKLNTLVKDISGRNKKVLEIFVRAGAPENILYLSKPHIGTDILVDVVKNLRSEIISLGGEIHFNSKLTDIIIENNQCTGVMVNDNIFMETNNVILAIGHSARDTFALLNSKKLNIKQKAFAIGIRIEHPQADINFSRYGKAPSAVLGAADYKLSYQSTNGRGVYTFCMCPGGYVVNASSEKTGIAINGMSNYKRNSNNANSAVVVTVTPEDFPAEDFPADDFPNTPLAGVYFQQFWESKCFVEAGSRHLIPVQLFTDFKVSKVSKDFGGFLPEHKGSYTFGNLRNALPTYVSESLVEGINFFGRKIPGFNREDAILSGIETRTSSPIRIERNEQFESNILGIFPCGEGAGYAGGITSAAMDGIKVAEELARRYKPMEEIV